MARLPRWFWPRVRAVAETPIVRFGRACHWMAVVFSILCAIAFLGNAGSDRAIIPLVYGTMSYALGRSARYVFAME